ncbi:hypothetical protein CISIN_1g045609mg [Citrus sinensis]|uniref:Uncharacterized protein n=1 Tax=Citrus sinensis TaxID=2711 RepID=A0A067F2Q2_CITSI|nr:hypothetical protein CISIN_1g045609mg [Citrus sinensis]
MFIQTLPCFVQSRILSFLALENKLFSGHDLCRLARDVLGGGGGDVGSDFWAKRAARNLLDVLSESNNERISGLSLDSEEQKVVEEFESLPGWIQDFVTNDDDLLLPWLYCPTSSIQESFSVLVKITVIRICQVILERMLNMNEIEELARDLRERIVNFESSSKTVGLANEMHRLCLDKGVDSFAVLGVIEPWKADDEMASVLISHLSNGSDEELSWPSQVLCSVVLPKLLVLEELASRVLMSTMIEYCKIHQRAAVHALLFPLFLRKGGINNAVCEMITRIVRECLHPGHVSAFCQKVLSGAEAERKCICLPCHQSLISNELVWTESLFTLFQNILNHNVHLTQDSVDHIVYRVRELTERFSKSLKFGNFLLCLVNKCAPLLISHKVLLVEAVQHTNTIVTKSILSKLANF